MLLNVVTLSTVVLFRVHTSRCSFILFSQQDFS